MSNIDLSKYHSIETDSSDDYRLQSLREWMRRKLVTLQSLNKHILGINITSSLPQGSPYAEVRHYAIITYATPKKEEEWLTLIN